MIASLVTVTFRNIMTRNGWVNHCMEIHRIDLVNGIALSTNIVSTYSEITHSERNPFFNVLI